MPIEGIVVDRNGSIYVWSDEKCPSIVEIRANNEGMRELSLSEVDAWTEHPDEEGYLQSSSPAVTCVVLSEIRSASVLIAGLSMYGGSRSSGKANAGIYISAHF